MEKAMRGKQKIKIAVDVCMTGMLFILMAYHYVGAQWHEIAGTVMFMSASLGTKAP